MAEARRVLITGCSSGIGLRTAQAFLAGGWTVLAGLRRAEPAPPELTGAEPLALDLEQPAQIEACAARIERLDCLVNNAGYALTGPYATYTPAQMRRQIEVNLIGPALLTQRLLPALRRARGRVIFVSSISGECGMPMNALYCASKSALEGLAESLRHELAIHGIQVALVEPGSYRTRFMHNMEWGARAAEGASPEAGQLEGYRALQARIAARAGRDPAVVARAIVRLAERAHMPLRTRVGWDARLASALGRWLPERAALGIFGAAYRRALAPRHPR